MLSSAYDEKLTTILKQLKGARSMVYVSSVALDHGDTDLELRTADLLKQAFEALDEASCELSSIHEVPHG